MLKWLLLSGIVLVVFFSKKKTAVSSLLQTQTAIDVGRTQSNSEIFSIGQTIEALSPTIKTNIQPSILSLPDAFIRTSDSEVKITPDLTKQIENVQSVNIGKEWTSNDVGKLVKYPLWSEPVRLQYNEWSGYYANSPVNGVPSRLNRFEVEVLE